MSKSKLYLIMDTDTHEARIVEGPVAQQAWALGKSAEQMRSVIESIKKRRGVK